MNEGNKEDDKRERPSDRHWKRNRIREGAEEVEKSRGLDNKIED